MTDMRTAHIHTECPEGARDAQKCVGARGRVQTSMGQVTLKRSEHEVIKKQQE